MDNTKQIFKVAVEIVGGRNAAADILDVDRSTVTHWSTGKHRRPGAVMLWARKTILDFSKLVEESIPEG